MRNNYCGTNYGFYYANPLKTKNVVATTPLVNIYSTAENFVIELAAAGMSKEDFKISVEKNRLTISVQRSNSNIQYAQREFDYNNFKRVFSLPEHVNSTEISAKYEQGILYVNIPKKQKFTKDITVQ